MSRAENIALPEIEPTLRIMTRPNDANIKGDIFGGWLMSQFDIAGAAVASRRAQGPVVTAAVKEMRFLAPLYIHDVVSFYARLVKVGSTSLTLTIDAYAQRLLEHGASAVYHVSEATIVYVAVVKPGVKRIVPPIIESTAKG